ncbi:hypothetical protein F5Y19DRAFT_476558 [Xylariaceae sp. FL1651]|nr:hypothetical protein F5Y19DRAFT_476558 [Xylariaceae sp. FL1651]
MEDQIVCNLPAFLGRDSNSTSFDSETFELPLPCSTVAEIETAWCVTLYMYTNLSHVCFQSKDAAGKITTKASEIRENDVMNNIAARFGQLSTETRYKSNTATVFVEDGKLPDLHDIRISEPLSGLLWQGIDLALFASENKYAAVFRCNFMSKEDAKCLAATFYHILRAHGAASSVPRSIQNITINSSDLERISRWNGLEVVTGEVLVHEEFSRMASIQPDAVAIESWDGQMTYHELDQASDTLAHHLRQIGIGPDDWVLLCFTKSRWAIISMMSVLKAGAAFVPVDPRFPELRVRQIIETTQARHALVCTEDTTTLMTKSSSSLAVLDVSKTDQYLPLDQRKVDVPRISPQSPAIGLFTSGSTGTPKGIIAPHAAVCTGARGFGDYVGANSKSRFLQFASYTFDMSYADIITALLYGACLCIPSDDERMGSLQDYISRVKPTWANLTPTVARMLDPALSPSIEKLLLAGELVKETDVEGWIKAGVQVFNVYGPAENVLICTVGRISLGRAANVGSGKNTRTWVVDIEKRRLVPVGAIGELVLEGPQVAPGYLRDSERTKKSFLSDLEYIPSLGSLTSGTRRFYRTGDLVRQFPDGTLECMGRVDAQVKLGGQRVELSDIESNIDSCRAVLLLPKAGSLANRLTAVLQTQGAAGSRPSSLLARLDPNMMMKVRSDLAERVPSYMVPSIWLGIDKLPASTSNKLDRKALQVKVEALSQEDLSLLTWADNPTEGGSVELDAQQVLLRDACSQVLNLPCEQVVMTQSFAGLGGDSITAMQVSSRIRRAGNKTLAVKYLLTCPSLLNAAAHMEDLNASRIEMPVIRPLKPFSLSPMQHFFIETAESSSAWHHYNQNVLLRLTDHRELQEVECAMAGVISRHPMLRARFKVLESGEWVQCIVPESQSGFQLEYHSEFLSKEELSRTMLSARQGLNLFNGPVVRAQLFREVEGTGTLLFIVAHHICVDLVSWRVIVEELEASMTQTQNRADQLSKLSQQSVPFLGWVQLQLRASQRLQPTQTIPYQPLVTDSDFSFWGILPSQNVYNDVKEMRMTLNHSVTNHLLHDCHRALRTEPIDILLASILLSLKRAFPERKPPPIFNEGHGRESWDDQLDISRTVGWFTTVSPICVNKVDPDDITDIVRRVKDFRKATPTKGFDYFSSKYLTETGKAAFKNHLPAEILFNYEGRYQSLEKENALLKPESWTAGEELADMGPQLQRFCLFELSAAILSDGQLHFTSAYNSRARYQERIVLWLEALLPAAIQEIVASLMAERPQLTLSDIGKSDLTDYSEVDMLMDSILRIPGIQSVEDVESLYYGSPMQNSLAISQSKALSDAYEIDFTWEVTASDAKMTPASISPERLASAWLQTVSDHTTLRTVFLEASITNGAEMLHQVVLKSHKPCCISIQANDRRDALDSLAKYPSYREQGLFSDMRPPHRLIICLTLDGECFVRLQINHILFDGMSISPLLRDIGKAYISGPRNERAVTALRAPFEEFIHYIREPERRMKSIGYWKSYLANAKPCLFPSLIDTTMAAELDDKTSKRGSVSVPLSVTLPQLQHITSKLQITLPTFVHLAWALVLRLYTGERQVAFGYLSSGRDAPIDGIEGAVGPFLAMLVCFVDFGQAETTSIVDALIQIQRSSAQSIAHQGSSLAEIQSALNLPGNSLLFNSGISFLPKLSKKVQMNQNSPLIFETISEKDPTEFDLSVFVEIDEHERTISMHLDYLESAINSTHATNVASSINHMLSELTRDPYRRSDDLCNISQHDLSTIWKWNEPLIAPLEKCAHEIFAERVISHPDKEAIYSWDGIMTYRQLDEVSTRLGKHLVQLGVGPEKMIPVCFEKSLWAVVAILAIIKAGGCFVLLDPAHPTSRLWNLIKELESSVLVCSPVTNTSKGFEETINHDALGISVIKVDSVFMQTLPLTTDPPGTAINDVRPENLVYAVFTSGTTGAPKGTLITHRALATGLKEHADATGMGMMGTDTRSLQFASFSFDAAIGDVFTTIQVGGCLCILSEEERSPADTTAFIAKSKANWTGITPSFASLLKPTEVPTLRAVCLAGEPLPASQVDAWVDRVRLINMYGPTECTIACVANSEVTRRTGASNIGRGYRATTWIVDESDHDRLRPVGTIGELLIEGPVLARGYLKRPEQTAKVFIDSPPWLQARRPESKLYKTGDLVRYNSDGTINFIGRKDTQIKINGQRVEVGEIESVLSNNIERSEATVIVELLKRVSMDESDLLVAFVCVGSVIEGTEEMQSASPGQIISTSQSSLDIFRSVVAKILHPQSSISTLPRYMIPQAYIPLDRIPLSVSGKTDRRALQNASAQLSRAELVAFTSGIASTVKDDLDTEAEVTLAKLWQKVLNVKVSGKQSNFIHLGGDSLNAMALRAEVLRAGFTLSVADIFANPDLVNMAEVLGSSPSSETSSTSSALNSTSSSTPPDAWPEVNPFSLLPGIGLSPTDKFIKEISRECGVSPGEVEDIFPCTPMQEGLMALASSKLREGAYALHAAFKLPASLDIPRFLLAWEKTVLVYPLLRSRIVPNAQGSLVVVTRNAVDAYHASGKALQEHLAQQRNQTFSYGRPLFRFGVFEEDEGSKYLVLNAHHAIYDGWSIKLIWDAALALYGNGEGLSDQGPPFQAFVRELGLLDQTSSQSYWSNALIDQDQDSFKFPIVPGSHYPIASSSKTFCFQYSAEATRSMAVTASELLNAVWAITLSQYSASSSVAFGVTLSGRDFSMPGADRLVGPMITTVPRQLEVRGDQSVSEFLRHVQRIAADALPHQYLGLQKIRGLGPAAQQACDFTSLLIVTPSAVTNSSLMGDAGIVPMPIDAADFHPYPLALECKPETDVLNVEVAFDPDCIDGSTVEYMMQQFNHVLQSINKWMPTSRPRTIESLITEIPPLHLDTMVSWNSRRQDMLVPPRACYVQQLIEAKAAEQPFAPAIRSHDASLSYAQLDQLAETLSCQILRTDPKYLTSPFVGLYMDKSAAAVVSMLAILKSNLAFMPLGPSQPLARTQDLVKTSGTKLILASPNHYKATSSLSAECHALSVELTSLTQEQQESQRRNPATTTIDTSRPAYLLYTSGTTGLPKGVVMEHGAWSSAIYSQTAFFALSQKTRMLQFSSYTFDVSLFEIFVTLASGGCVIVPSEHERMNDLSGFIRSMNVTSLSVTPTVARLLDPRDMSNIDRIVFAGEALTQADIDAWICPGRQIINAYGPTETCVYASARNISTEKVAKKATNIGKPLGVDLWVVHSTRNTLCPIGAIGELCIGGTQLARGYFGDNETTAKAFTNHLLRNVPSWKDNRLYRTGDLVRFESDGSIDFLGRRDAQVKLRGQRISLGEIEHYIQKFMGENPKFRHATVHLHKQEAGGASNRSVEPYLVALLIMDLQFERQVRGVGCSYMSTSRDANGTEIAAELRRKLRSILPGYMVPSAFIALERLPTTISGKLDRQFIQECLQGLTSAPHYQPDVDATPLTPEQKLMQEWWSRALGIDADSISADSDFFAFGGNSLSGIKLVSLARLRGIAISYENVISAPILSDMATYITTTDNTSKVARQVSRAVERFELVSESKSRAFIKETLPLYDVKLEDVEDIYPTTPLQESVMALTARNRNIYIMILTMEVPVTQLELLKDSWKSAFRDFELLRTRIIPSNHEGAYQLVMKNSGLDWKEVSDVKTFVNYVYESHDYGQPLTRMGCVVKPKRLSSSAQYSGNNDEDDTVTVLFSASHAIYDGWSLNMLWPRLFPQSGPTASAIRTEITPFRHFIQYQKTLDSDKAATFWRSKLDGLSSSRFPMPPSPLSSDHVTAIRKSITRKFAFPSITRDFGVTAAIIAQAAWTLTVSHLTANQETLFRVFLSGRDVAAANVSGIETIAGPTATVVPFRTIINHKSTVSSFFSQLQRDSLEVARHAHIGLERISRLSRDCRKACEMISLFNFQAVASEEPDSTESGVYKPKMLLGDGFSANCLMAELTPLIGGRELLVALNYDPAYVQETQTLRIMDAFITIMENLYAAEPTTTLREAMAIPVTPLQFTGESQAPQCLHQHIRQQAQITPFQQAVHSWDGDVTYMQLEDLSSSLAEKLARLGAGPGKAVGLLFEPSKWSEVSMLGVLKVGGFFVNLHPESTYSSISSQMQKVGASILLTTSHHASHTPSSPPFELVVVDADSLPPPTTAFLKPSYQAATRIDGSTTACAFIDPGTLEMSIYHHKELCSSVSRIGEQMGLGAHSRMLHHNSCGSSIGLLQLFGSLTTGATACIPSPDKNSRNLVHAIEELNCNIALLPRKSYMKLSPTSVPSLDTVCVIQQDALPNDPRDWSSSIRVLSDYATPLSHNEELLASLWKKVLGIDDEEVLGRSDNFFALGANSLLAMRLSAQLHQHGFALRVPEMFKAQTLAQMAIRVSPRQAP